MTISNGHSSLRKRLLPLLVAPALALCALSDAVAQARPDIRIAIIQARSGPLEEYGNQASTGFRLGLDHATGGTLQVAGRKIVLIERDDQGKPDIGKSTLATAYSDDKADIAVASTSSSVTLAMLPVAEEAKKILLVEPAAADSITGAQWNRYIFRTSRSSSQEAIANAVALDKPGVSIATLSQNNAFGRDGVQAFKQALKSAKLVQEEYLPPTTTDFSASAQRLIDALKNLPGRKIIWVLWAGSANPFKIADLDLGRYGIEIAAIGNSLAVMAPYKGLPGLEGATYYYYGIPKNPVNDWLVAEHQKRFKTPPDFVTAGGMSAAIALVTALTKTNGDATADKLIAAMEGMSFESPKGMMTFRKEDHQALQSMYHFRIKSDPAVAWGIPELVREIKASEMNVPVLNRR